MDIIPAKVSSANFAPGRNGDHISMIIVHTEQGTDDGTTAWFDNPAAHASAHYSISFEGRVRQFVKDADTAWHSGNAHVNRCSIGIELEGWLERARFPDEMTGALTSLIQMLASKYSIKLDRNHIIGHCEVPDPLHPGKFGGANNHQDPGPAFPWAALCGRLGMPRGPHDEPIAVSVAPLIAANPPPSLETDSSEAFSFAGTECQLCHLNQAIMSSTDEFGNPIMICGSCASTHIIT